MQAVQEARLLDRLRAGDAGAYEELVRRQSAPLLAATRRILRSEEDARDAVQEAFLKAFEKLHEFQGEARLSTWLHRIAINAALMRLRRRRRRPEEPIDDLLPRFAEDGHRLDASSSWAAAPDDALEHKRRLDLVRAAIDRLPESYRTVLVLRDVEGLSTEEAAAALELRPAVLKMRLHRARQALRSLLDPHLRGAEP